MNKYLAINIGPISDTLSMARKPMEFWAASYLFSYLAECILEGLDKSEKLTLISPYYESQAEKQEKSKEVKETEGNKDGDSLGVGLYPDRCFYRVNSDVDMHKFLDGIVSGFAGKVKLPEDVVRRYFNIMVACNEYESSHKAICGLNNILDSMELNRCACDSGDYDVIYQYLRKTTKDSPSPLFPIAFGERYFEKKDFKIKTMEEIAKAEEKDLRFSRQKYVCIVQADGDGMGSIVKSPDMEGRLKEFSKELMDFGKKACEKISEFKGYPIYAGGDDLLFIAPVCGKDGKSIFDLIDSIDTEFGRVQQYLDNKKIALKTSMSYGISVIYYKYPLYEAWKTAADMLFGKAKKVDGKNAVAIKLRKSSGSDLEFRLNKGHKLYTTFKNMIISTPKESIISAIAHKVRASDALLNTLPKDDSDLLEKRVEAFYKKTIDAEAKSESEKKYMELTRTAFLEIFGLVAKGKLGKDENEKEVKDIDRLIQLFYSMLRIAKFIKGEEMKDE